MLKLDTGLSTISDLPHACTDDAPVYTCAAQCLRLTCAVGTFGVVRCITKEQQRCHRQARLVVHVVVALLPVVWVVGVVCLATLLSDGLSVFVLGLVYLTAAVVLFVQGLEYLAVVLVILYAGALMVL